MADRPVVPPSGGASPLSASLPSQPSASSGAAAACSGGGAGSQLRPSVILEKTLLNRPDDSEGHITELLKRGHNHLHFGSWDIAKSYVRGDVNLAIELHSKRVGKNYRVTVQRADALQGAEYMWDASGDGHSLKLCGPKTYPPGYWHENLVFVGGIEDVQPPKKGIPSFVWLEFPQEGRQVGKPALYFSLVKGCFEFLLSRFYREPGAFHDLHAIPGSCRLNGNVESGPEVMKRLPDDDKNFFGRLLSAPDLDVFLPCRSIRLDERDVGIFLLEGDDGLPHLLDLAVGPFNL